MGFLQKWRCFCLTSGYRRFHLVLSASQVVFLYIRSCSFVSSMQLLFVTIATVNAALSSTFNQGKIIFGIHQRLFKMISLRSFIGQQNGCSECSRTNQSQCHKRRLVRYLEFHDGRSMQRKIKKKGEQSETFHSLSPLLVLVNPYI